jgi:hypothetical protein
MSRYFGHKVVEFLARESLTDSSLGTNWSETFGGLFASSSMRTFILISENNAKNEQQFKGSVKSLNPGLTQSTYFSLVDVFLSNPGASGDPKDLRYVFLCLILPL